jgi:undecaprenyl-diphosphatase
MLNNIIELNNSLFLQLHSLIGISKSFDIFVYIIAEQIDWYLVGLAVIFMLIHQHSYRSNTPRFFSRVSLYEGFHVLLGILIAWGTSYLMKISFAAPRPFLYFIDFVPLFPYGGYDSFPSGHATLFSAIAVSLYFYHKKIGIFFGLMALLIGISRIIAGVHFPIDIIAGWILGIIIPWLIHFYSYRKK